MRNILRVIVASSLLLAVIAFVHPHQVIAEEGFNVITSPLPIKLTTTPGKTVEAELRIKNQGNKSEGIKVGLMKFSAKGQTGEPNLYDLTPSDKFGSWVHFSPEQFVAQPNVWITVKMTINVPESADLGYFMAVTFSPANFPGSPNATSLKGSAATLVLLNVKTPNEKRVLKLADFTVDHKLYEYLPTTFTVKVHNTGNVYISPVGNIFIQKSGKKVATLNFNEPAGSVLPGSYRLFNQEWQDGFPVFKQRLVNDKPVLEKSGKTKQDLRWDFSRVDKFRFGKYSATLLAVYDDGTRDVPVEATVSFWVIPWKLILLAVLILLIVGLGVFVFIRSFFRKTREGLGKRRRHAKP